MKRVKRFARFIGWTMILFQAVSLAVVVGVLYTILSRTMTHEHENRLQAQSARISMALSDRLSRAEHQLRDLGMNNAIRVSLMLGVDNQVKEQMSALYPPADGAIFFIRDAGRGDILPALPRRLDLLAERMASLEAADRFQRRLFFKVGEDALYSLFAIPVFRQDERLATAFMLDDIAADAQFWRRFDMIAPGASLLVQTGGALWDLRSGDQETRTINENPLLQIKLASSQADLPGLKELPDLFLSVSDAPLQEQQSFLILILAALCASVFLLTILVSFWIVRRLSDPLESMANQAMAIARDPAPHFLKTEALRYREFQTLADAFNGVLRSLLDAQNALTNRARQALDASEDKYRSVVNQSAEGIYQVDTDSKRIVEANPAMQRLLGYNQTELSAMTVYDFVVHDPPDVDATMGRILREGHHFIGERRYRKKNGQTVTVEVGGNLIAYGGKEVISVVCRDITAKKKMEGELLKMQKLESLGLLAGGIAHDFNNILTGIIGNLSLAKLAAGPETALRSKLAETERACMRAKDLTQQLLTFAKGGAPIKKTLPLSGLIREAVGFTLRGSNVACRLDIADDLLPVDADEGQITQVINNLVINAQQAMPEGGALTVTAVNRDKEALSGLPLKSGRYVSVTIRDQGPGIPPAQLEKIFDPYFTTKKTGSGLGLAVVYSIVKKHGGHIAAASEPDAGAAFTLYLPASRATGPSSAPGPDRIIPGRGRILIMDDEQTVRFVLQEMLRYLGYDPAAAEDGAEAISTYETAMAEGAPFDAIIMDLTIPGGMGGQEAIGRLRKIDPHVRAIVSSGYANDAVVADFRQHGFSGVLSKPYQIEALSELLSTLTGGADERDGEAVVEED